MTLRGAIRFHQQAFSLKAWQDCPSHLPDRATGKSSGQCRIVVVAESFHDHGTDALVQQPQHGPKPSAGFGCRRFQGLGGSNVALPPGGAAGGSFCDEPLNELVGSILHALRPVMARRERGGLVE